MAQSAVRRLPRWVLWTLCLAYVLPGFVGRTPWKAEDMQAFGFMRNLAVSVAPENIAWLKPTLLGQVDQAGALLPYWLGAWAIQLAPIGLPSDTAAHLPFIALLGLTLVATWYAVYALARTPAAQPVSFAFGGEAKPADYARAIADGGLLALIASLGLARLSHEATPALAQLAFAALLFFALANLARLRIPALLCSAIGIVGLALSGAPALAMFLGAGGAIVLALDSHKPHSVQVRRVDVAWVLIFCLATAAITSKLDLWQWRIDLPYLFEIKSMARLLLWFTWPTWPLALWTLWRWRYQLKNLSANPHLSLPLWFLSVAIVSTWLSGVSDRALLLALPALATLAAFALPTLKRSMSAFIDWFRLWCFSVGALFMWTVWLSMQTGFPAQPAINVARLAPGFVSQFSWAAFIIAGMATLAWASLVKWRAGRHRSALWKSMVLPASGASLCWLLIMTLWLPLLDFARSYAPLVHQVRSMMGDTECVQYHGLTKAQGAAFEFHGNLKLYPAVSQSEKSRSESKQCAWLIVDTQALASLSQEVNVSLWTRHATVRRPSDNNEDIVLFRALSSNNAAQP